VYIYICIDMYMYDDSIVHVYDIIKVHIIQLCHIYIYTVYIHIETTTSMLKLEKKQCDQR
jgi:hypothetical protein